MAENVVFTGIGKPETVKPRLVDKVWERVTNRLKQNTDQIVEQKWMDAYQRTVDTLDPGMRKKVAEKMRIVAVGASKVARVGSAVSDFVLRWGGFGSVVVGTGELVRPEQAIDEANKLANKLCEETTTDTLASKLRDAAFQKVNNRSRYTPKQMRTEGAVTLGAGLVGGALAKARISRVAVGWLGDIAGSYGEKVAQITNKIFTGRPKVESAVTV